MIGLSWLKNEIQIIKNGTVGECPFCGSKNTSFEKVIVKKDTGMGYMKVWCNTCNSSETIDRVQL